MLTLSRLTTVTTSRVNLILQNASDIQGKFHLDIKVTLSNSAKSGSENLATFSKFKID